MILTYTIVYHPFAVAESSDFKDNYFGAVTADIPGAFKLHIPIFKG